MFAGAGGGHFRETETKADWRTHRAGQTALQRFHHAHTPVERGGVDYRSIGYLSSGLLFAGARTAGVTPLAFARAGRERTGRRRQSPVKSFAGRFEKMIKHPGSPYQAK